MQRSKLVVAARNFKTHISIRISLWNEIGISLQFIVHNSFQLYCERKGDRKILAKNIYAESECIRKLTVQCVEFQYFKKLRFSEVSFSLCRKRKLYFYLLQTTIDSSIDIGSSWSVFELWLLKIIFNKIVLYNSESLDYLLWKSKQIFN